jgi:pyruvate/2-oxoglutarate dehydrogenase complex dihydrolipoamide dehydrogenase (E3) component
MNKKIVVIGAGSGGLTVAIGLVKLGFKVIIVEKEKIGGDCTNFGCVPSKALLYEAKKLWESYNFVDPTMIKSPEFAKRANLVLEKTRSVVQSFNDHETSNWLQSYGLEVILGEVKFLNENSLLHGQKIIPFTKCIVASGSTSFIPDIKGLEKTPFLTNKNIFSLKQVPKDLIILGNGPIGIEMAEAFNHLGSRVTVICNKPGILLRNDRYGSEKLQSILQSKGITFTSGIAEEINFDGRFICKLSENRTITAENLLVATGRKPNIDLNLESAGVKYDKDGIIVDKNCRSSNKNIFAVGDVVSGVPRFTHYAYHMGKSLVSNFAVEKFTKLPIPVVNYKKKILPSVVFTSFELAEAGYTEELAKKQYGENKINCYTYDFADVDRAKTHSGELGHIKFITKGFFAQIIGVSILAKRAGEILPEFQALIQDKKNILSLNKLIRSYPSYTSSLDNVFKEWLVSKKPSS